MEALNIECEIAGTIYNLNIVKVNGMFEVLHEGNIITVLRPPGEDWQLLPIQELIGELPIYEEDLHISNKIILHTPDINRLIGIIENHFNPEDPQERVRYPEG